ncbi:hypothetical protein RB601_009639 [Gaeumannomyces tritici]
MKPATYLAALMSLTATVGADPTWPHVNDNLEEIMFQTQGFRARLFTDNIRRCANEASGPGRKNAAEWLRTGFHDIATANRYFGTGGMDASLQYELNSGENAGPAFASTFKFLGGFLSPRSSLADLVALGVYASVRSCGGQAIPVKAGRKDATEGGALGVPQTQNPTPTFVTQFDRMGFNQAEMIQLVACGHTLGSVHTEEFPDIVPPGTGVNGAVSLDSTDAQFDNKVVTEYLDGTTQNPLVVGPSVQLKKNADGRVFGADGNVTMNALRDAAVFQTTCRNILQRMIEVVPSGVTLTDPIVPYTIKPVDMQLTLDATGSTLAWSGWIRVRTTTIPLATIRNVVLNYKDRNGGNNCGSCATTLTVQGTGSGLDDTWAFFPVSASLSTNAGISSFTVTVNKVDGTSTSFDNNGASYPLSDAVMIQRPQSCLLQGTGALTVSALVRNDRADLPVNLGVSYLTDQTNSPAPKLNTDSATMTKGNCVGGYTFFSASYTIAGGRSYAARLDINSGSGADVVSDAFNLGADLGGTCQPFTGSQTCASVTVSSVIPSSTSTSTTASSTTTSTTPTATLAHRQTISGYNLVSCWTEGSGVRALSGASFAYDGMTLESCIKNCTGFAYAGAEYGRECYCGNTLAESSAAADMADCNMPCSGNPYQYCGAGSRLELYRNASLPAPSSTSRTSTASGTTTLTSSSTAPTGTLGRVDAVGKFSYRGCYTEGTGVRALADKTYADDAMTLESCAASCSAYNFFGTEYGRECYCGNSLASSSTKVSVGDCSFTCAGNRFQYCGAGNRLDVFGVGSSGAASSSTSSASGQASTSSTTRTTSSMATATVTTSRPSATGPSHPATIASGGTNWSFSGCQTEATGARALSAKVSYSDTMTLDMCASSCSSYAYFGVEYGRECYCGDSFAAGSVAASEADCNFRCPGNADQYCGAGNRLSTYHKGTARRL